jgi:hypothetical protein
MVQKECHSTETVILNFECGSFLELAIFGMLLCCDGPAVAVMTALMRGNENCC